MPVSIPLMTNVRNGQLRVNLPAFIRDSVFSEVDRAEIVVTQEGLRKVVKLYPGGDQE